MTVTLIILIALAIFFGIYDSSKSPSPRGSVEVRNITIRIPPHSWSFEPNHIEAKPKEALSITIVNDDDVEHGFAIEEYRIRQSVPANGRATIPTFILSKEGTFSFYCSVVCGDGTVEDGTYKGDRRGHFDMEGTLTVTPT